MDDGDEGGGGGRGGEDANGGATIGDKDVASVVLSYLTNAGFDRAAVAFRR